MPGDGTQSADLHFGRDRNSGLLRTTQPWENWWSLWESRTDPTIRFFFGLLFVHVILWSVLPMLLHHNPSRETLQLLTLGRQWAWGYHQQAPLPAWLAISVCTLTGTAVWPTYVLSAIAGAVCVWCAWKLGREFLQPWTAVCAALAMEACLYFTYTVPVLCSATFGRTFWALAVLAFYWATRTGRRTHWVQTAVCLGLGLLCRYDTVFLVGAMLLFTFWNDRARKCWDTSRPFLALGVMSLIVTPHLIWVAGHVKGMDMTMMEYLVATEQLAETTTHPLVQVLALIPVWLVLVPLVNWFNPPEEEADEEREFVKRYLVWASCLPPAVMAAIAIVNQRRIDALWMSPLWTYGGVLFILWSRLEETRLNWRRTLVWTGMSTGIIAGVAVATYALFPPSLEDGCEVHFPGPRLAQLVRDRWENSFPGRELKVVGGDWWLAGNTAWYSTARPYVYAHLDPNESPLMRDEKLRDLGGVVVLDAKSDLTLAMERIRQISPNAIPLPPVDLPWQHTAVNTAPVQVQLVMIPPFSVVKEAEELALKAAGLGELIPSFDSTSANLPIGAGSANPEPSFPRSSIPASATAPANGTTSAINPLVPDPQSGVRQSVWGEQPGTGFAAPASATGTSNPFDRNSNSAGTNFSPPVEVQRNQNTPTVVNPFAAPTPVPTPTAPLATPGATRPFTGSTIPRNALPANSSGSVVPANPGNGTNPGNLSGGNSPAFGPASNPAPTFNPAAPR